MDDYSYLRLAGSLLLVVTTIVVAAWGARKLGWHRDPASQIIDILDTRRIGPRHTIMLVKIDGARLVLGTTPQTIALLQVLPSATAGQNTGLGNNRGQDRDAHSTSAMERG